MYDGYDEPFEPDGPSAAGSSHAPFQDMGSFTHPLCTPAPRLCPKCQSTRVEARHRARKAGGAIGTVAGTTSGVAFALSSAKVGLVASPARSACGALADAIIAGLIGGAAGCATGATLGEVVDDKVLNNFRCHACGYTFSCKHP